MRSPAASAESSWMACRTSCAGVLAGKGAPKDTVTGYGMRLGNFQKNLPPSKLKMLPHTRSRCTGMMGASVPSRRSFSSPRLNGSMLPVRREGAFGKNADHMTGGQLAARGADGFDDVARTVGVHGNGIHAAQERAQRWHLVVGLPDHEADEALHAGADEEAIDIRYVIRDQQGGPRHGTFSAPTMRMRKNVWVSGQRTKRTRNSSTAVAM